MWSIAQTYRVGFTVETAPALAKARGRPFAPAAGWIQARPERNCSGRSLACAAAFVALVFQFPAAGYVTEARSLPYTQRLSASVGNGLLEGALADTGFLLVAGIVVVTQALLIVALAVVLSRRRRDRQSLAELRRNQALGDAILASLGAQACVVDHSGRVVAANEAWKHAATTSAADVAWLVAGEKEPLCAEGRVASADVERIRAGIRAVLDGARDSFAIEYRVTAPGADGWYLIAAERICGSQSGAVLSRQNVTARKRAELEADHQRRELAHVSRVSTIGELAGAIADELYQPLTGVLMNAQAALRHLDAEPPDLTELRAILCDIVEDDRRACEVIRRLRAMLRTDATESAGLDVNEVVAAALRLLRGDAMLRGIEIASQLASSAPRVHGDQIQLQQVIVNLVVNAMDAMTGGGEPERQVTVRTSAPGHGTVLISVEDTGPGIDQDKLGRVFQPFFTTKAHGLGMGLSIARSIVEAHGGVLWAVNNPTCGATFLCRLPSIEPAAVEGDAHAPTPQARHAGGGSGLISDSMSTRSHAESLTPKR